MTAWVTVAAVGVGTLLFRGSFLAILGERELPTRLTQALRFVPAAVLTALVTPSILMPAEHLDLSLDNLRWPAALVAAVVAWKTRNIAYTLVVGMVALWLAQAVT